MGYEGETHGGRVLVVDDDRAVRMLVARHLALEGYEVDELDSGQAAVSVITRDRPDLVLLDLTLPGQDGLDVLTQLRRISDIPVILLTGRDDEGDRVLGLKLGGDDYIVKPFSPAELAARISSVLRRSRIGGMGSRHVFSGLCVDVGSREVTVKERIVATTAREFDLLACLASAPRQVFSREQLLRLVWGSSSEWQDPATVTEHVRRLRKRIEADPERPRWIVTVRGAGYRFEP